MELDDFLERLKAEPLPDLSGIDGAQLAIRAGQEQRQGRALLTTAAVTALMIGVVGSQPAATASASVVPFGPPTSLMPLVRLGR
jgi:hypothetical protein